MSAFQPHPQRTQSPPDSTPSDLAVFDAEAAIALMDNSLDLYRDIALAYLLDLSDMPSQLQTALQQQNLGEATRTLHTFKGLSLTVGARAYSELCRQFELQMISLAQAGQSVDDAQQADMIRQLRSAAEQTRKALEAYLSDLHSAGEPVSSQPLVADSVLVEELRTLKDLLAQSDLQALDRFAALQVRHGSLQDHFGALELAIKAFDFGRAVVQCDELIRSFGAPQPT